VGLQERREGESGEGGLVQWDYLREGKGRVEIGVWHNGTNGEKGMGEWRWSLAQWITGYKGRGEWRRESGTVGLPERRVGESRDGGTGTGGLPEQKLERVEDESGHKGTLHSGL